MAVIKPFYCIRPTKEAASRVAALPYDVYDRKEAKEAAGKDALSFLNIDRPETQFTEEEDMYADHVYQKAGDMFHSWKKEGIFIKETEKCFYIYELIMNERSQTGVVGCALIDDYMNNVIKRHENTREEKEQDRIKHVNALNAQTGPIFLAYRANPLISSIVAGVKKTKTVYSFTTEDGITHNVWKIMDDEDIRKLEEAFDGIGSVYIADGHHRAASAVKSGLMRRQGNNNHNGTEEYNYFLSVLFPENELKILPYNRAVKDLNGYTDDEFINEISMIFEVRHLGETPYSPEKKGYFGMFLSENWYELKIKDDILEKNRDEAGALDVSILHDYLLSPLLGIDDERTDTRIEFIGGIRGLKELEKKVRSDMAVAFSMYPTSIQELFLVSDSRLLMPPKSTWFEPKLRSGLFIHEI